MRLPSNRPACAPRGLALSRWVRLSLGAVALGATVFFARSTGVAFDKSMIPMVGIGLIIIILCVVHAMKRP